MYRRLIALLEQFIRRLERLWKVSLRFHRGKIIGAALGLLIGLKLFGFLFGLIAGQLVDTIYRHYSLERDLNRFDGTGSLGNTAHGRVATATLCALTTAAHAKRTHEGRAADRSGAEERGEELRGQGSEPMEEGSGSAAGRWSGRGDFAEREGERNERTAGGAQSHESAQRHRGGQSHGSAQRHRDGQSHGGPKSHGGPLLDGSEIELIKRQVIRGFALSAEGRQVVEAVHPAHRDERNFEQLLSSDMTFPEPPEQYALMQCLFEAASLFGPVTAGTRALVERVRAAFAIPPEIEQMAYLVYARRDIESYRVLGVDPEAPIQEIKRVYRSLAVQFHPDSLSALEPEQQKTAEEAFLKIRNAYESIMRERQESRGGE